MKKIRVSIEGDGRVTIKLKKRPVVETRDTGRVFTAAGGDLLLSFSLINQMEIRVESVFRPGQSDAEIAYALSGSTYPDMLHKFSSNEVVAHATQERIVTAAEKMAEHILRERPDAPNIIVGVHTHPEDAAVLSAQDISNMPRIAAKLKERIAGVNVVFAVHAVSRESPRERTQPVKIAVNRITWSSITRKHEVAFFNEKAEPVGISI